MPPTPGWVHKSWDMVTKIFVRGEEEVDYEVGLNDEEDELCVGGLEERADDAPGAWAEADQAAAEASLEADSRLARRLALGLRGR